MTLGVALSVTAVTLLGALVGNRFGLVAAVGRVGPLVVACVAGSVLVRWGFHARWFQPFGLGTPIIAAIPVSMFLWLLCRFILYERHKENIPFAGTLIEHFTRVRENSRPVTLAEVEARPLPERFRDSLAWLLTPYL